MCDVYQLCRMEDVEYDLCPGRGTAKSGECPANSAKPSPKFFLSNTHPAPNSNQRSTEGPAGTYKIGPIRFDQPYQWTVRFHLYEECSELLATSPHGHVAFYVWVP